MFQSHKTQIKRINKTNVEDTDKKNRTQKEKKQQSRLQDIKEKELLIQKTYLARFFNYFSSYNRLFSATHYSYLHRSHTELRSEVAQFKKPYSGCTIIITKF